MIQKPIFYNKAYVLVLGMLLLSVVAQPSFGQQPIDIHARYQHALDLYQRSAFKAARLEFTMTKQKPYFAASSYYIASCAIRSGQDDGAFLVNQFVENFPHHVFATRAYLDIADYYFNNGDYKLALENYDKSKGTLTNQTWFRKGYTQFHLSKYDAALKSFAKLKGSQTKDEVDAAYYQGYIYHHKENLAKAYPYLKKAFESVDFGKSAAELYISILYQEGKYEELIALVNDELTPVKSGTVLNYLADAQYATEKYRTAAMNYGTLLRKFGKRRNEKNYFRAGYSSYVIENMDDAIEHLKRSAVTDDSVGAYASYYLGVIYSQKGKLPFAVTSFENTAKYNTLLLEDAIFYQSKSMMAIPNFKGAINVLNGYKAKYPKGKFIGEVEELLGLAYASTNDYDLAIDYIEGLDRLTSPLKQTYQRVSFLKGVNLFNDKKFSLSTEVFQKSLLHDMDESITQQTYFWTGEALSVLDEFDDALFYYNSVSIVPDYGVYLKAMYGKAYAHYNKKNYGDALASFKALENSKSDELKANYYIDALLRMADCNFAMKQYQEGIDYYIKADKAGNKKKGYINFQIGLLSRYLDKKSDAEYYFRKVIKETPKSSKVDHAQFQIAQMDFEVGNEKKAIASYDVFLNQYPNSNFIPYVLLNQAVAYDNVNNSAACIANYKQILNRFPRHQTANSALLGLQGKNANGDFDDFPEYFEKYKKANPNSQALENIEFEAARSSYYSQQYEAAIKGFLDFMATYRQSALIVEANYFIADAYFRREQYDKSLTYFKGIEKATDFSKHPKVLYRIAMIFSNNRDFDMSNSYYFQLKQASSSSRNVINVENGLMQNHFNMQHYDSAMFYGNALLDNPRVGVLISANAQLIIGKANFETQNLESALLSLLPLVSEAPDERGAEAYYYISKIYHQQEKSDRALESLFVLTNNFQNYQRWVEKAYLLMADIYIETNEIFQAKATLNSLIENALDTNVKSQAQERLNKIAIAIEENNN